MEVTFSDPIEPWLCELYEELGFACELLLVDPLVVEPLAVVLPDPYEDDGDELGFSFSVPFTSTRWFRYFDQLLVLLLEISHSALWKFIVDPVVPVAPVWPDVVVGDPEVDDPLVDDPLVDGYDPLVSSPFSLPIETFVSTNSAPAGFWAAP
jgi:hypothetical protein